MTDYKAEALHLSLRRQAFIGGRHVDALSGETFRNLSSIDGRLLGDIPSCGAADIDLAVKSARGAFERGLWSEAAPAYRKAVLLKFADIIERHTQELALLDTIDMGKPIALSRDGDVPGAVACIRWCAEYCDKMYGDVAPTAPNAVATITREPIGVAAAVIPWNFPLVMAAWKIGPALAMGNSLILKPAEQSPLSALRIAEMAAEAGIPEGVFNVVPGFGETAGQAIGLHPDIDTVAFTGSTFVGKMFLHYAAQSNMKRIHLECGGKSPSIIMPDADLDFAAETAAWAVFYNQGECCDAMSRLLVHVSVRDAVLEKISRIADGVKVGHLLEEETQMGAVLDERQFGAIQTYLEIGEQEGARRQGGEEIHLGLGGKYMRPALLSGADNSMRVAREEIFGPVITAIDFETETEALRIANDSDYGLAASIFTTDLSAAHRMSRKLRAGAVWVNCYDAGDMTVPHGGYKQSGIGRDRSPLCFDAYTETKMTWVNLR